MANASSLNQPVLLAFDPLSLHLFEDLHLSELLRLNRVLHHQALLPFESPLSAEWHLSERPQADRLGRSHFSNLHLQAAHVGPTRELSSRLRPAYSHCWQVVLRQSWISWFLVLEILPFFHQSRVLHLRQEERRQSSSQLSRLQHLQTFHLQHHKKIIARFISKVSRAHLSQFLLQHHLSSSSLSVRQISQLHSTSQFLPQRQFSHSFKWDPNRLSRF
jgi:hypothetical protein